MISETEEEFFQECVGDGRMPDKPDLAFIQQMLDMVSALIHLLKGTCSRMDVSNIMQQ